MRKLIIATTLTVVLAGSASAAPDTRDRDRTPPRNGDTPIVKMIKSIKRGLGIVLTGLPTIPQP